jgi:hypothetical protein
MGGYQEMQRAMICKISGPDGARYAAYVKDCLLKDQSLITGQQALRQNRYAADYQGLTKAQFSNPDQYEQEIHRDGAVLLRHVHVQPRSDYRDQQVGDKLRVAGYAERERAIRQSGKSHHANTCVKKFGPVRHKLDSNTLGWRLQNGRIDTHNKIIGCFLVLFRENGERSFIHRGLTYIMSMKN